jgi:hypothetical protein
MVQASEMFKIITFLGIAYPNYAAFSDVTQAKNTAKVWADMLGDIDFKLLEAAVKRYASINKWPPSIAEIRENALNIISPQQGLTAADAWGEVMSAIRNFGIYREVEALESMPPKTRKVVKYIGWKEICQCEQADVMRGQFRMMYEQTQNKDKQEALLPEKLKLQIRDIGRLQLSEGKNNEST